MLKLNLFKVNVPIVGNVPIMGRPIQILKTSQGPTFSAPPVNSRTPNSSVSHNKVEEFSLLLVCVVISKLSGVNHDCV